MTRVNYTRCLSSEEANVYCADVGDEWERALKLRVSRYVGGWFGPDAFGNCVLHSYLDILNAEYGPAHG